MMRRCVNLVLHMLLLLMVIDPKHREVARFLESEWQKPNLKRVRMPKANTAFAPPRFRGERSSRDRGLIALVAHQMKHRVSLRSNTIGESVRVKCDMVAQTEPGTILLRSLGHGGFFPGGKVVP